METEGHAGTALSGPGSCAASFSWRQDMNKSLSSPWGSKDLLRVGTSLAVQGLRLHSSAAWGVGSIPGQGAKMPHAERLMK